MRRDFNSWIERIEQLQRLFHVRQGIHTFSFQSSTFDTTHTQPPIPRLLPARAGRFYLHQCSWLGQPVPDALTSALALRACQSLGLPRLERAREATDGSKGHTVESRPDRLFHSPKAVVARQVDRPRSLKSKFSHVSTSRERSALLTKAVVARMG
jgi:hypothetical protein